MAKANETIADIIAEMRERAEAMQTHGTTHGVKLAVREFANRIEAAAKREAEPVTGSHAFGNATAMREALIELTDKVIDYLQKELIQLPLPLEDAAAKARTALTAPARNCDVGTAEEQVDRHREWCNRDNDSSYCCNDCRDCFARWAQMPEAEGGGAE